MCELLVDHLFPERHLLLRVPAEPVPANNVLQDKREGSLTGQARQVARKQGEEINKMHLRVLFKNSLKKITAC